MSFSLNSFKLFSNFLNLTESTFLISLEANRITLRVTRYWKKESFSFFVSFSEGSLRGMLYSIVFFNAWRFDRGFFLCERRGLWFNSLSLAYIFFIYSRAFSFISRILTLGCGLFVEICKWLLDLDGDMFLSHDVKGVS